VIGQTASSGLQTLAPDTSSIELRSVSKSYGGVYAVSEVSLVFEPGTVHAIVGENGAGKSTIVKLLTGVITPDSGSIFIDGKAQRISEPNEAIRLRIAAMFQDPTVFPQLTVAENMFAGRLPRGRLGHVDWPRLYRESQTLLDSINVNFSAHAPIQSLGIADRQLVEIAKALSSNAQLLIMDEPTAALSPREVERLLDIVRRLRADGQSIIFISHRLEEVAAIADTISVMRDGRLVVTRANEDFPREEMAQMMVGRAISERVPRDHLTWTEDILRVEGLTRYGYFTDISFRVRKGEIVGLAGFVGAGRSEIARSIFGLDPLDSGRIWISDVPFRPKSPRAAVNKGLAYLPEDRVAQGLVATHKVVTNMSSAVLPRIARHGMVQSSMERQIADHFIQRLAVRPPNRDYLAGGLSGGNQQKVVLAKWLATEPVLLILDEPTHGVDVGTRSEVHDMILDLADHGLAVLLISSEMPELLAVSDRILVIREGRITADMPHAEASEERLVRAAAGLGEDGVVRQ
jgi:rhamnose transport system ATP-binding protein